RGDLRTHGARRLVRLAALESERISLEDALRILLGPRRTLKSVRQPGGVDVRFIVRQWPRTKRSARCSSGSWSLRPCSPDSIGQRQWPTRCPFVVPERPT